MLQSIFYKSSLYTNETAFISELPNCKTEEWYY